MSENEETIELANEFSLGQVVVYAKGDSDPTALLDAVGIVRVPEGATLYLDLSQEVCDDLQKLQNVPPRLLTGGVSITQKRLDKVNFSGLEPLSCLVSLSIGFCGVISSQQLRQLGQLYWLEHLDFAGTELGTSDFSWLLRFPRLNFLGLGHTCAGANCIGPLIDLPLLEHLNLVAAGLTDENVQSLWFLPNLSRLILDGCDIGDGSLERISECHSLRFLSISRTRISDKGVEIISRQCTQLGALLLDECPITDRSLMYLSSLKRMSLIAVRRTDVTPEGVAFFKRVLPNCRVSIEDSKKA